MDDGRVHMGLVLTGGTIGSGKIGGMVVIDLTDPTLAEASLVEESWRGPGRLQVHTRAPLRKLSEEMDQSDWLQIASAVRSLVEDEGLRDVLVFHGTDTAAYTSAALSFLLADLDATVVITGSNVPSSELDSDAATNVQDALTAARHLSSGVYLSFAGVPGAASDVHMGSTVRKVKADGQAYESPNFGPVARVVDGELDVLRSWPRRHVVKRPMAMSDEVLSFAVHPGIDLEMLANALVRTGKKGVVVRLYPCATAPTNARRDSLPYFVRRCVAADISVVACLERFVDTEATYPSLTAIQEEGALFASDMIQEVAFVKLCWALGQTDESTVRELFEEPIAGESISAARSYQLP